MKKLNCWEFKNCELQPDGKNVRALGVCPAAVDTAYDGINNGENSGRFCWAITGTLCADTPRGSHAKKLIDCIHCDFFLQVNDEENREFILNPREANKMMNKAADPATLNPNRQPTGTERILIVDDDRSITRLFKRVLEKQGYWVWVENDSLEALKIFSSTPEKFDLIITDFNMPKLTGDQLAYKMLQLRHDIPVIMCTGCSDDFTENMAYDLGIKKYCTKPLCNDKLISITREVLNENN